jgi:hypothetical protein
MCSGSHTGRAGLLRDPTLKWLRIQRHSMTVGILSAPHTHMVYWYIHLDGSVLHQWTRYYEWLLHCLACIDRMNQKSDLLIFVNVNQTLHPNFIGKYFKFCHSVVKMDVCFKHSCWDSHLTDFPGLWLSTSYTHAVIWGYQISFC